MQIKNKISLHDYPYKRDIEGRIFISELSSEDIHILKELINLSTKFTLFELSESADVDPKVVEQAVDNYSKIGLALRQNQNVFVDKELRKYFELHIHKFFTSFNPDFHFIKALLHRVPLAVLPRWYDIPKSSDTIFDSILEKCALTPKLYEQYLEEIAFDEPVMNAILQDVLHSPDLQVPAAVLRQRYGLTKEKFQEYILLFEFNLTLISSFEKEGSDWIEVLTPIHEWRDFLQQQRKVKPYPIENGLDVKSHYQHEFGFLLEMQALLTDLKTGSLPEVLEKAELLGLIEQHQVTAEADEFKNLHFQEQIFHLYRRSIEELQDRWNKTFGPIERTIREIQKRLHLLPVDEWFLVEEFTKGLLLPIGNQEPIRLKNVGKKWRYVLPAYSEETLRFVTSVIFELLFPAGIVSCGYLEGKLCFKITSFGHVTLSE